MKIVTWNTQWCCGLDGVVSPQRIVESAHELAGTDGFDVLCLQEIAQGYADLPGHPGDQPAELTALLPGYQLFFGAAVDELSQDNHRQRFGNLVATRLPVQQVAHHMLPWPAEGDVPSMPRMCTVVTVQDPLLGPVRVMTTHLEYYSQIQRNAQADALRALHLEACAHINAPPKPLPEHTTWPFRTKAHTPHTVLCGDFNMQSDDPAYARILTPHAHETGRAEWSLQNAWLLLYGMVPQAPTFRLFDRRFGPDPVTCDFIFVSGSLAPHVHEMRIDGITQVSDHQPVLIRLG
ncbi:MAG: endonuclease/exonuclease/phosphatase family protein [Burkholderiales bacterium]|nr:endonuclease/exonuclease/phosphatase family protein [Burkholderiales bacterium]